MLITGQEIVFVLNWTVKTEVLIKESNCLPKPGACYTITSSSGYEDSRFWLLRDMVHLFRELYKAQPRMSFVVLLEQYNFSHTR